MCKQIRHTYYCEELFLIKHKTKHSCESAIFYNLTANVVYSVCQFDYFYNTTVTPGILDGGSNILLANMLSPKRLICTKDSPMAQPLPSHSYVLVNWSILCNCHLQTGLNYLLKLLSSCDSGALLIQPFNISCQNLACLTLLTKMADYSHKNIFLTYFSMTHQSHQYTQTHHGPYYLWTLQTLFWNCFNPYLLGTILPPVHLFFLLSGIPV